MILHYTTLHYIIHENILYHTTLHYIVVCVKRKRVY